MRAKNGLNQELLRASCAIANNAVESLTIASYPWPLMMYMASSCASRRAPRVQEKAYYRREPQLGTATGICYSAIAHQVACQEESHETHVPFATGTSFIGSYNNSSLLPHARYLVFDEFFSRPIVVF